MGTNSISTHEWFIINQNIKLKPQTHVSPSKHETGILISSCFSRPARSTKTVHPAHTFFCSSTVWESLYYGDNFCGGFRSFGGSPDTVPGLSANRWKSGFENARGHQAPSNRENVQEPQALSKSHENGRVQIPSTSCYSGGGLQAPSKDRLLLVSPSCDVWICGEIW